MNKTFQYSFKDLAILPEEIEELMGFEPGQAPEPFPELIEQGLRLAPEFCQITGGYKIFDELTVDSLNETIRINDQVFHTGETVVSQLKNATQAALFVCTAGTGISMTAKEMANRDDEFLAYVLDVIGSVTVDKAAGKIQEEIGVNATPAGMGITDPFSPGYCNWSVAEQQKLFALLPPGFCGISLSETSLMSPVKSVSGITGIGKNCKQKGYQCNWCNDRQCIYGKIRRRKKTKKN